MLDMNGLRMGKILEVIDMLTYDSCHKYVSTLTNRQDIYFASIAMAGLTFQNRLTADADLGLVSYPIASTTSTLTVRTDVM